MILKKLQSGYSLVEVLVATVILAVGILGIAGLQVVSIQQNRSALFRTEATKHATDILDRIRVNNGVSYAVAMAAAPAATSNCGVGGNSCSSTQMKDYDLAWWKCSINQLDVSGVLISDCNTLGFKQAGAFLPGGEGSITLATADVYGATTNVYTVTVQWNDDSMGNTANIVVISQVN